MANNRKPQDNNVPANELRGGTQGGGTGVPVVSNTPGGTNALSPTGAARPIAAGSEPPTGDKAAAERQDPHRIGEGGRTQPSESAVKQRARDEANVQGSHSGLDEGNPRQIPENAPNPDGRTGND